MPPKRCPIHSALLEVMKTIRMEGRRIRGIPPKKANKKGRVWLAGNAARQAAMIELTIIQPQPSLIETVGSFTSSSKLEAEGIIKVIQNARSLFRMAGEVARFDM